MSTRREHIKEKLESVTDEWRYRTTPPTNTSLEHAIYDLVIIIRMLLEEMPETYRGVE